MTPAISVVMGVYNGGDFLFPAIESILKQSFTDFEFIIINDGSKDGSGAVIDAYAQRDPRIVAVHQENKGLIATLNHGLEIAKAPLIARMDADDIALPGRFAAQIEFMRNNPEIAVLGTSIRYIDDKGQPIHDVLYQANPKKIAQLILTENPIAHPTVMMRKDWVLAMGGYHRLYKHTEDYDLWLRLSEQYPMANLPEIHLLYRQHNNKITFQHSQQGTLNAFIAQLASKTRRAGKTDPTTGLSEITAETLKLFDISAGQEAELLFKTLEYSLNASIFSNDENALNAVIAKAESYATNGAQKRFLAMIYLKAALFYSLQKNYLQLCRYAVKALLCSPTTLVSMMIRRGSKIGYRVLQKLKRTMLPAGN